MLSRAIMTTLFCGGLALGVWSCQRQDRMAQAEENPGMAESGTTADTAETGGAMPDAVDMPDSTATAEAGAMEGAGGAMEETHAMEDTPATEETGDMEADAATEDQTMGQQAELPDATGAALWSYLQSVDYRAHWQMWPGKGELYPGRAPHGPLLTTYLNPAAYGALTGKADAMPAGAIIVKENYDPDSTLTSTTVIYKVDGYDPAHNNWFWLKRLADGTVQAEGHASMCITCHSARAGNDYLYTGSLGSGGM